MLICGAAWFDDLLLIAKGIFYSFDLLISISVASRAVSTVYIVFEVNSFIVVNWFVDVRCDVSSDSYTDDKSCYF